MLPKRNRFVCTTSGAGYGCAVLYRTRVSMFGGDGLPWHRDAHGITNLSHPARPLPSPPEAGRAGPASHQWSVPSPGTRNNEEDCPFSGRVYIARFRQRMWLLQLDVPQAASCRHAGRYPMCTRLRSVQHVRSMLLRRSLQLWWRDGPACHIWCTGCRSVVT